MPGAFAKTKKATNILRPASSLFFSRTKVPMVPEPKNSPNDRRRRLFLIRNRHSAFSLAQPTMAKPATSLLFLYLALLTPCHAAEPGGHVSPLAPGPDGPHDQPLPLLPPLLHPPDPTPHPLASTLSPASCDITVNVTTPVCPCSLTVDSGATSQASRPVC